MNKILLLLIVLIFGNVSYAQVNVKIEGFGSISCPQSLEVQGGNYKAYADKIKEINGVSASNVIFQQQGLNEGVGGLDTYARVMIKTTYGDFNSISTPVSQIDVNDVNRVFENKIKSEAYSNNAVILSWSKAIATSLNGYKALKFGYKRQIGNNPVVTVETYLIQNSNRMYSISFECRTDTYNWPDKFALIKKSILIK